MSYCTVVLMEENLITLPAMIFWREKKNTVGGIALLSGTKCMSAFKIRGRMGLGVEGEHGSLSSGLALPPQRISCHWLTTVSSIRTMKEDAKLLKLFLQYFPRANRESLRAGFPHSRA